LIVTGISRSPTGMSNRRIGAPISGLSKRALKPRPGMLVTIRRTRSCSSSDTPIAEISGTSRGAPRSGR
jgi:hypothetical protein